MYTKGLRIMKTVRRMFLAAAVALVGVAVNVQGAAFTSGNLVVYRIGDGSGALTNTGNRVFLDEYTTGGSLVQSIAMPTNWFGASAPLLGANGTSEGFITLSVDGRFVLVTGYAGTLGLTNATVLTGLSATTVPRVIGLVDGNGVVDTSTVQSNAFSNSETIRSAASTDGTNLWFSGDVGGIRYTTRGTYVATQLTNLLSNTRVVGIASNQLYFTAASGSSFRLAIAGTEPPPTTNGTPYTNLPGFPAATGSPYAFVLFNLTGGADKIDTLYYTDDSTNNTSAASRLYKFSLVGGNWMTNGFVTRPSAPVRGLAGKVEISGTTTNIRLFVTASPAPPASGGSYTGAGTYLLGYTDSMGWNAAPTGDGGDIFDVATFAVQPSSFQTFRGVAFAPVGGDPFPSGAGRISVGPLSGLTSSMLTGCVSTATKEYSIANPGDGSVDWSANADVSWVDVTPAGGVLDPGSNATVTVSFNANAGSLGSGTNTATISFVNETDNNGDTTRPVTLIVSDQAQSLSPSTGLNSSGLPGGPFSPLSQTYALSTAGTPIDFTVSKSQTWLDLDVTTGSLAGCSSTNVTVSINTNVANILALGSYSDTVTFSNAAAGALIASRSVTLTVTSNQFFCDEFSAFSTGNLVGQSAWQQLGSNSSNPLQVTNSALVFPAGQTAAAQTAYKNFPLISNQVGSVFLGMRMTITAAVTNSAAGLNQTGGGPSYITTLYQNNDGTISGGFANYRFAARCPDYGSSGVFGGGSNFFLGGRVNGQAAAPWTYGTTPFATGETVNVIVMTDLIAGGGGGSNMTVIVNPTSAVLGDQTPYLVATFTAGGGTLVPSVGSVGVSQFGTAATPSDGAKFFKICVSDNYADVYNSLVGGGGGDPYASWVSAYGLTGGDALGTADPDGDGMSNTNEFLAGFSPTSSTASLRIITVAKTNDDINVTYLGANGDTAWLPGFSSRTNVLEFTAGASGSYSNDFTTTGQTNVLMGGTGTGVITNMIDAGGATNVPSRFYRIRVLAP
jgi:hypothetical protein